MKKYLKFMLAIITLTVVILFIGTYYISTFWVADLSQTWHMGLIRSFLYVSTKNMMLICAGFGAYYLIHWSVDQFKITNQ